MIFGFYNYLVHAIFAFEGKCQEIILENKINVDRAIIKILHEIQSFTQIDTKVSSDVIKINYDIYLNHFISHFLALLLVLSLYLS